MYCSKCQREIADYSNFCYFCGSRQVPEVAGRRLVRSAFDKKIAGVCGGFAEYFDTDPTVLRIIFVFVTLATGILPRIVAYVVAWILMPLGTFLPAPAAAPPHAAPGSSPH